MYSQLSRGQITAEEREVRTPDHSAGDVISPLIPKLSPSDEDHEFGIVPRAIARIAQALI